MSLTTNVSELEEARDQMKREHNNIVRKTQKKAKTLDNRTAAELNVASSCYHSVLQCIRGIVKAIDERNASHSDTLTQLLLFP